MKKIIQTLSLCLVLFLTSCTKPNEDNQWQAEITENKAASLKEVFLQNGSEKLLDITASKDEVKMSDYNKVTANQIASYFKNKFKIDITKEFIDNPEGIVILGLFYAKKEQQDANSQIMSDRTNNLMKANVMQASDTNDCYWAAVTGILSLADAKNIWKAISAGATEETVIAAAKLIGRRVGGIIMVTIAILEIGECIGWW
jgi:hypothetical protein